MSDLETPQARDLAADLAALSRGLRVVPLLVDQLGSLGKQVDGTTRVAQNVSDMALAACEAELRSMNAISSLIQVMRDVFRISPVSNVPMQALDDAARELDTARERINHAMEQVMARSEAGEPPR
jgi:hypothetical protein